MLSPSQKDVRFLQTALPLPWNVSGAASAVSSHLPEVLWTGLEMNEAVKEQHLPVAKRTLTVKRLPGSPARPFVNLAEATLPVLAVSRRSRFKAVSGITETTRACVWQRVSAVGDTQPRGVAWAGPESVLGLCDGP